MTHTPPQHRTIRIRLDTYHRLKVLAAKMGISMLALIERWLTEAERTQEGKQDDS
jgi:hypothetical protein